MAIAAPSLQCANQINLAHDVNRLDNAGVKLYHIDVMDGHFVPNLAFNIDTIRQLKEYSATPISVHLMVERPEDYLSRFKDITPEYLIFHSEATNTPIRLLQLIKGMGIKPGIAINPATTVDSLGYILEYCELVLVMSVEPGYAGQTLLQSSYAKITKLNLLREEKGLRYKIEVDGGTTFENLPKLLESGTDIVVAGATSIFKSELDLAESFISFNTMCEDKQTITE